MRFEALPLRAPEPEDNPGNPAKIALGRRLFFDPILSANHDVACATCHHPRFGWADGRTAPIGAGGIGLGANRVFRDGARLPVLNRNAPSLINVAFNGLVAGTNLNPALSPMFWDSRVLSLEGQVSVPIRSREEMRGDFCSETEAIQQLVERLRSVDSYRQKFGEAFAGSVAGPVTAENLARAIAAFERTLIAPNAPFDRFQRGDASALSPLQQQGMRVFQTAGCIQCHGGPMFSDFKLHFIGVTDPTRDGRIELRTPTLRNLLHTGPYMHNGSLRTINDVLIFYEQLSDAVSETLDGGDSASQPPLDPLLKFLNLAPSDFPALAAFLDSLNDPSYDQTIPTSADDAPSR